MAHINNNTAYPEAPISPSRCSPSDSGDASCKATSTSPLESTAKKLGPLAIGLAILKANIGPGLLYLPKAFVNGGWLFACIALPLLALLAGICSLKLVKCRKIVPEGGYGDIIHKATGSKWGRYLADTSLIALQSGIVTGYFVFVADMASQVSPFINELSFATKVFMQVPILAPLCWIRHVSGLNLTNILADCLILVSLCIVVYFMASEASEGSGDLGEDMIQISNGGFLVFLGTALYTFEGIGLIIPTYDSMANPEKFPITFSIAFTSIGSLFLFVGMAGYLAFGEDTATIILENLPQDVALTSMVKVMYIVAVMCSFPFQLLPAVQLIERYTGWFPKGSVTFSRKLAKNALRTVAVLLLAALALVAGTSLDHFISLVGGLCGLPLAFIGPALCHLKLVGTHKAFDWAIIVFGVVTMIGSTTSNLYNWVNV